MKNKFTAIALAVTIYLPIIALIYSQFAQVDYNGIVWNTLCLMGFAGGVFIIPLAIIRLLRTA